ncbi:GDSL esterase/lipase exl3, variant 2 [Dionaea muscipula]
MHTIRIILRPWSSLSTIVLPLVSNLAMLLVEMFVAADGVRIQLPPNVTVTAIYGFGDSIIDPGNNNDILTIVKCNFKPYGQDFSGGIPTGRFSNGRIPTDLLAEALGLKEYVPAYLDPNLESSELLTGVSFASGASGYDPMTPKIASAIPLSDQLEMFKEYKVKLKAAVGEERADFIVTNSVALAVSGSDDIANTYFDTPFRRAEYDVDSYTDLMTNSASSFLQELYKLGIRRVAVFSAPPIGCVPSQRTIGGGVLRPCAENYNEAAKLFNAKLSSALDMLNSRLPKARLVYTDIYNPLLDLIQNPSQYGFEVVDKGCCGTGVLEVSILCNKLDKVCDDDAKYIFWDSYHPTEAGYKVIIDLIAQKYIGRLA